MIWPFRQRSVNTTNTSNTNNDQLQQIERLLFPPLENHRTRDGIDYCVDRSVDTNLHAALIDLEEGFVDEFVLKSIKDSVDIIEQIRKILNVHQQMVDDPSMLVVAPPVK